MSTKTDFWQEFKEDLDFLVRANPGTTSEDLNQYPDLLQLQRYVSQPGLAATDTSAHAPAAQPPGEFILSQDPTLEKQKSEFEINEHDLKKVFEDLLQDEVDRGGEEPRPGAEPDVMAGEQAPGTALQLEDQDFVTHLNVENIETPAPLHPAPVGGVERQDSAKPRPAEHAAEPDLPATGEFAAAGPQKTPGQGPRHQTAQGDSFWTRFGKYFQMPAWIGIDAGTMALKTVSLQKTTAGFSLSDYSCTRLPQISAKSIDASQWERRQQKIVEGLRQKFRKADYLCAAVSGLEVIYRMLQLPKMSRKDLQEAVPWAMRKDLPYDLEEAIIGYEIAGVRRNKRVEKQFVSAVVAPQKVVQQQLSIFQKLAITPASITAVPVAIWNVIKRHKRFTQQRILVIEIGTATTHLVFLNHGLLEFHREITTAGNELIEAMVSTGYYGANRPPMSAAEAMQVLERFGIPSESDHGKSFDGIPLSEIGVNLRPVLERLVAEIRRSMDYYREKFKIEALDQILVSGGGGCIKNLYKYLQGALGDSVALLNPFVVAGIRKWERFSALRETAPRFTVAVGLALHQTERLNLLPPELRGIHRVRKLRKFFGYIALVVLLGFGLTSGMLSLKLQQIHADLMQLQGKYKRMEPLRKQFLALKSQQDQLQKKLQVYRSKIFINKTAVNHLRAISNLVPSYIALNSLSIVPIEEIEGEKKQQQGEKVILRGFAFPDRALEGSNLAAFLLKLQKSGYFQSIEIADRETSSDGSIRFEIHCFY